MGRPQAVITIEADNLDDIDVAAALEAVRWIVEPQGAMVLLDYDESDDDDEPEDDADGDEDPGAGT